MTQQQMPRRGAKKAASPKPAAATAKGKAASAPAKPVPLPTKPAAPKAAAPPPKATGPAPKAATPAPTAAAPGKASAWGAVPASVKSAAPTLPTTAAAPATTGTAAAAPAAAPAPKAAIDIATLKPQAGRKPPYTLTEARAELAKYHHAQKSSDYTKNQRKEIAKAWGDYILTNLAGVKAGKVRDTYKSSWDHGDPEEFSVSQEIDGIPEIVIHAHMDKAGKAKGGNGVHWKWSDKKGEKMPETYEMSGALVAKLLDSGVALKSWQTTGKAAYLAKISLPTTGGTAAAAPVATAAAPTTPAAAPPATPAAVTAAPAPTVTLPTTGKKP